MKRNVWTTIGWYPSQQTTQKWLARHGYFEQSHTPGLCKYVSRPIWFNLCMDDVSIKYIGQENLQH